MDIKIFSKNKKPSVKRHERFNPHKYWRFILAVFFLFFVTIVVYFILVFKKISNMLNEPVVTGRSENGEKILDAEKRINKIEKFIETKNNYKPTIFPDPSV